MRSLDLRTEPSIRQTETILRRIDEELTARGAQVARGSAVGGLRFQMPRPWNAPRLGVLLAITSGRAVVSAGAGGPWRVRYSLDFSVLRVVVIILSLGLIAIGLSWPDRRSLLNALALLWLLIYGIPYAAASIRFHRIIQTSATEVIERRHVRRAPNGGSVAAQEGTRPENDPPADETGVRSTE